MYPMKMTILRTPSRMLNVNLSSVINFEITSGKKMKRAIAIMNEIVIVRVNAKLLIFSCSSSCSFAEYIKALVPRIIVSNRTTMPLKKGIFENFFEILDVFCVFVLILFFFLTEIATFSLDFIKMPSIIACPPISIILGYLVRFLNLLILIF